MNSRRLIRSLVDEWRKQGWRFRPQVAVDVAGALAAGKSAGEATRLVPTDELSRNQAERGQVLSTVLKVAGTMEQVSTRALQVVVLTAIPDEFKAVRALLEDAANVHTQHGTQYVSGRLAGSNVVVNVAEIGAGNLGAAAEVAVAVAEFKPDLVAFVGVAGGLKKDFEYGDVVVANRVHYVEGGRDEADGFRSRPLSFPTAHRVDQHVRAVARDFPHRVFVKPIAAGEVLVASSRSRTAELIKSHYNDAVAVDMESGGVYDAAARLEQKVVVVRGISDRLDDKSSAADTERQPLAASRAAEFLAALVTDAGAIDAIRGEQA